MKYLLQNPDECFITALAMVSHIPVAHLRRQFEDHVQRPYDVNLFTTKEASLQWFNTARYMLEQFAPYAILSANPAKVYARTQFADIPCMGTSSHNFTARLLIGTGLLSYQYRITFAHAVAFRDGIIYDSSTHSRPEPMPYATWKRHKQLHGFKKWIIDVLTTNFPMED